MASSPRDGTVVAVMQTYGITPWCGLFKWTNVDEYGGPRSGMKECDGSPGPYELWPHGFTDRQWDEYTAIHCREPKYVVSHSDKPDWRNAIETGSGIDCSNNNCLWRPFTGDLQRYELLTNNGQEKDCSLLTESLK